MKPCHHDSRPIFESLIEPIRRAARELGYAIAVHGSLKRDIDLVACPWSEDATDARTLAEAVIKVAADHNMGTAFLLPHEDNGFFWAGCPGAKPHGRLVWSIHLGGGPYLDLSVMPTAAPMSGQESIEQREDAERRGPMTSYVRGSQVFNR